MCDLFGDPGVEFGGPGIDGRVLVGEADAAQIVHDAAGANDEDVVVAQGAQGAAELEEFLRREEGHGELEDGDSGFGPGEAGGNPGAVIEPADGIERRVLVFGAQGAGDARGEARIAGRGVLNAVELVGKAAEIVEQGHAVPGGDAKRAGDLPVGGDDQDGARSRVLLTERVEGLGVGIAAERGHRGAVSEKGGRGAHVHSVMGQVARP